MVKNLESPLEELVRSLLSSDNAVAEEILRAFSGKMSPNDLTESLISPALADIGEKWMKGEASLSQVYVSSRICEDYLDRIMPTESPLRRRQPKTAVVTLEDYHTLGKKIVIATLRANGFEIIDYGTMDVDTLAARAVKDEIKMLMVSTLMLRSSLRIKELRRALERYGKQPYLVVGGAPYIFDPSLWQEVEADAGGRSSSDALRLIRSYMAGDLV